jgi:hypothetical protein
MIGRRNWVPPAGYVSKDVSYKVVQFILGGKK